MVCMPRRDNRSLNRPERLQRTSDGTALAGSVAVAIKDVLRGDLSAREIASRRKHTPWAASLAGDFTSRAKIAWERSWRAVAAESLGAVAALPQF